MSRKRWLMLFGGVTVQSGTDPYELQQTFEFKLGSSRALDVGMLSSHPDNLYTTELYVGESNLTTRKMRSLFKFPIKSSLPADAQIISATLSLTIVFDLSSNARTLRVYRSKRAWVNGQVTWNNYATGTTWQVGGGFGANDCEQTAIGSCSFSATETQSTVKDFPLNAPAIQEIVDGTWTDYGFLVMADTESDDAYQFYDTDNATAVQRPKLTIVFKQPTIQKTVYTGNPVLTDPSGLATWSGAIKNGADWHMYYTYLDGSSRRVIGHATSTDGFTWTKDTAHNPVINLGGAGKFDAAGLWFPRVWIEAGTWYMLYTGKNASAYNAIGLATSSDGVTWTKQNSGDPIFTGTAGQWDENDTEFSTIIKVGATYYLFYNTLVHSPRRTGLATASDILGPWTKDASNPTFDQYGQGNFCGEIIKYGDNYYYILPRYTSGTDYAALDLYRCTTPTFYPSDRQYLGILKPCGAADAWDGGDQDTPCIIVDDITKSGFTATGGTIYMYYAGATVGGVWGTGLVTFDPSVVLT